MKKFVIIMSMILIGAQVTAAEQEAVNADNSSQTASQEVNQAAQETSQTAQTAQQQASEVKQQEQKPQQEQNIKQTTTKKQYSKDETYLLKYNIDDLEAAPWLNGGNRKI